MEAVAAPRVTISVVTHNNADCLPVFLDSLGRQSGIDWEARFFDNASSDNTVELLERWNRGRVTTSATNIGYSRAQNENLNGASAEYFVIMNADVELGDDVIRLLAEHLDAHPDQALAGPQIFEGPERQPFPPRRFYPGEGMIPLEGAIKRSDIAWLNGCCFIIRRSAFEQIGGFDEDFFLYQAETDLCLRIRRAGHALGHSENATVVHFHRQSQREISEYEYGRRLFGGSAVFWRKHYTVSDVAGMARFQYWMATILLRCGSPLRRVIHLDNRLDVERLRARRDVCREILDEGSLPSRAGALKILSRQWRLAAEWIRRGHFPLDDY